MMMTISGLLNLNKPSGVTSRRVVDQVVRQVRPAKAGHAGTLDPLATGVLIVGVGAATRLIEYVQRLPKRYTATFLLGRASPTEDIEGPVTLLENPPQPSLDQVRRAAAALTGPIEQRPPAFSAVKVAGRRAYDLARAGKSVDLAPRPVIIHRLDAVRYDYPELVLVIECSSGTYVRSLGRDLAESLGTAAVMSALVRTAIGHFRVERAISPDELTPQNLADRLLPPRAAVESLPAIHLTPAEQARVVHGLPISRPASSAGEYAALAPDGQLVGILARRPDGALRPVTVLIGPA